MVKTNELTHVTRSRGEKQVFTPGVRSHAPICSWEAQRKWTAKRRTQKTHGSHQRTSCERTATGTFISDACSLTSAACELPSLDDVVRTDARNIPDNTTHTSVTHPHPTLPETSFCRFKKWTFFFRVFSFVRLKDGVRCGSIVQTKGGAADVQRVAVRTSHGNLLDNDEG